MGRNTIIKPPKKGRARLVAMNEALVLGSLRQHELTAAADSLNVRLNAEITERKLVEVALRESEERFRALFELGPVAVYSCDARGVVQNFNRRSAELWGREPKLGDKSERFCGSHKMFRPDGSFLAHKRCPMADVLSGKIPGVRDAEVVLERPDGSRVTIVVNIRPLKYSGGKITGAINCFYDITERKEAEAARRRLEILTVSNLELETEIIRQRTLVETRRQSELHQSQLLEQSNRMQEQMRWLSRQVLSAQEDERKEISRELHDVIAQTLTGINIRLSALKKAAAIDTNGLKKNIDQTQRLVEKSVDIIHQFARELRPAVLDDLGLIPALHTFLKDFSVRSGVHAHLTASTQVEQLEITHRTALFRVAQEALTNVARHAKASRVEVSLQPVDDNFVLKIKDDGKSFKAERAFDGTSKRLGLLGMRERVEMVGGTFSIKSAPGHGTTIQVEIPLAKTQKPTLKKSARPALKRP